MLFYFSYSQWRTRSWFHQKWRIPLRFWRSGRTAMRFQHLILFLVSHGNHFSDVSIIVGSNTLFLQACWTRREWNGKLPEGRSRSIWRPQSVTQPKLYFWENVENYFKKRNLHDKSIVISFLSLKKIIMFWFLNSVSWRLFEGYLLD